MATIITGTGSTIPSLVTKNLTFISNEFYNADGSRIETDVQEVIEKFKDITGIKERRYLQEELVNSDMAAMAAEKAIEDAGIDPETIDYIVVAHNYGDVIHNTSQSDTVPSLASRVKYKLGIKNPKCVAYDILFGCPGWLQAFIQCHAFIQAGIAKRCLVIGSETLSRVVDKHDRDSMIYSDGAGAVIIEASEDSQGGVVAHSSVTYASEEAYFIYFGESNKPKEVDNRKYIKMYGRKIYEFALTHVPQAMKDCLDKAGRDISELKKIFIHQANEKMDEAILKRFYRLFRRPIPENIMPMSISELGNSSVATIPTLFDLVKRNYYEDHKLESGDLIMFASVGAGMNINAMLYQIP